MTRLYTGPVPPAGAISKQRREGSCEVPASARTTGTATRGLRKGLYKGRALTLTLSLRERGSERCFGFAQHGNTTLASPRARCPRALDSRRCGNDETLHRPRPLSGRYFRSNDGRGMRGSCLRRNDGGHPRDFSATLEMTTLHPHPVPRRALTLALSPRERESGLRRAPRRRDARVLPPQERRPSYARLRHLPASGLRSRPQSATGARALLRCARRGRGAARRT